MRTMAIVVLFMGMTGFFEPDRSIRAHRIHIGFLPKMYILCSRMYILRTIIAFCFLSAPLLSIAQKKVAAVRVIFDSDMGPDYDDVGAIALLHAFADSGQTDILATIASTKYAGVAAVFNVFNTYFLRPDIPIGVPKGKASELRDGQHWSDTILLKYPHVVKSNDEVPDAIEVYRKVLSAQPDGSVTIITVGFLTNISGLLQSPPDSFSVLSGHDLVKKKVKQLVCMAGSFPSGSEFNVREDADASQYVFEHIEVPVIFSGVEIGWKVRTGLPLIHNDQISNSPIKDVFRISIPQNPGDSAGRMSWDETAVLVGVRGHKPWYRLKKGRILVARDGSNRWRSDGKGHVYLVEEKPPIIVERLINQLIQHQPQNSK